MTRTENRKQTLFLVQFSVLLALEAILCFTILGSLPIGPIVATTAMIPIIVTSILLGTRAGTAMGFFAGLFSFIIWTFMPPPTSAGFAFIFTPFYRLGDYTGNFWSLVICFVPRMLVGTVSGLLMMFMKKTKLSDKNRIVAYSISACLGSLTNTFLVIGGIALFFGAKYAILMNKALIELIKATIFVNGSLEALMSIIVVSAICYPIQKYVTKE